jgi:pimeloyl-ACP methyl ester carboxylesterase
MPGLSGVDLPGTATPGGEGGVVMLDRTDGRFVRCLAELDAHPGADEPSLIVRPLEALTVGHTVAVAVLGSVMPRPDRFDALVSGTPPKSLAAHAEHYRTLMVELEASGIDAANVSLAWDFPVGDGARPLRSALEQVTTPSSWTFDRIRDLDAGDRLPPQTWRALEGTFSSTDFLIDDRRLDIDSDADVSPTGTVDVPLYVHVPESAKRAEPGTVPVLLFGHGIFSDPGFYLDDEEDPSDLIALADEGGYIVVATDWRGLSWSDRIEAIEAAQDFSKIDVVTDRLVQAQANVAALIALVEEGGLLADPLLASADGRPLASPGSLAYYGISLGGIQGAVLLAQDPPLTAGVLHVGGAMWSTMLERSSNWPAFELFLVATVPEPSERQQLYGLSQLLWDPVDPMSWTTELAEKSFLLQEAIGDEQVPNMTTEAFARSVGLPLVEPAVSEPAGLVPMSAPLPPGSRGLVQLDPELGVPPPGNRPAEVSGAHGAPRLWTGVRRQTLDHLRRGAEGQIVHHCGEGPCAESNQGGE